MEPLLPLSEYLSRYNHSSILPGATVPCRPSLPRAAIYSARAEGGPMAKSSKQNSRLTTPLVRENGALRPATWDEALDRAAAGFRSAVEKHGPQTFGLFSCSKTTNEMNYLAQKFARTVVGSNNIDSCNRT